jgi:hypothetical protein
MRDLEAKANQNTEVTGDDLPSGRRPNYYIVIAVVVGIVAAGFLLFNQAGSRADCAGEGPCMLYFYAEW